MLVQVNRVRHGPISEQQIVKLDKTRQQTKQDNNTQRNFAEEKTQNRQKKLYEEDNRQIKTISRKHINKTIETIPRRYQTKKTLPRRHQTNKKHYLEVTRQKFIQRRHKSKNAFKI